MTLLFSYFEDIILLSSRSNIADEVCYDINVPNSIGFFLCGFSEGVIYGFIFVSPAQDCVTNEGLSAILQNSWPVYLGQYSFSVISTLFSSQPTRVYLAFLVRPLSTFSIFHILFWVAFWVTPFLNCIQYSVYLDVFYSGLFFSCVRFLISTFLYLPFSNGWTLYEYYSLSFKNIKVTLKLLELHFIRNEFILTADFVVLLTVKFSYV